MGFAVVKTIQVPEEVWEKLQEIKIRKRYRSLAQVIEELLKKCSDKV